MHLGADAFVSNSSTPKLHKHVYHRRPLVLGTPGNEMLKICLTVPTDHLSLDCFVYGDEPGRIFEIKIELAEGVSALKRLSKTRRNIHFAT